MRQRPPQALLPRERLSTSVIAKNSPVVENWLRLCHVEDESIINGIKLIEEIHYPMTTYNELTDLWNVSDIEFNDEYIELIQNISLAVSIDLETNQGKTLRDIIATYSDYICNSIFGNEAIRDWLSDQNYFTKKHFDTAVVAAVIIDMACSYINVISSSPDEN